MKKAISFILLFCLATFAQAQNPVYRTINNLSGLRSNTVYDMLQDSIGFIWIAHDKGLSKYDGKRFVNFVSKTSQGKAVSNLMYYKNMVYCQDFSGNFYYTSNDSLIKEIKLNASGYYSPAHISSKNELVSASNNGIRLLNLNTKGITNYPLQFNDNVIVADTKNEVKIFYDNKQISIEGKDELSEPYLKGKFFIKYFNNDLYAFTKNVYPYVYPLFKNKLPLKVLKPGLFIQSVQVIKNEMWICTSTGAYCFDENFNPKYDGFCFFEGASISKIIKDRENNLWFSTLNKGLFFVANINMRLYKYESAAITALQINAASNELLVGTEKNELLEFTKDLKFNKKFTTGINHEVLGINTTDDATYLFSNEFIALDKKYNKLWSTSLSVKDFTDVNSDLIAVAFSGGICLMSKRKSIVAVPYWLQTKNNKWENDNKRYTLESERARGRCISYNKKDSTLYFSTSKGLFYLSPAGRGAIFYNGESIFGSQIKTINGAVFVSTYSHGFVQIINKKAIVLLNKKTGLYSDIIYKFQVDENKFWMIEDGMVQCYDSSKNMITNYSYTDGLPRAEVKDILLHKSNVYIATTEGLLVFDKNQNTKNAVSPGLAITGLKVNNNNRIFEKDIQLRSYENNVDVFFSILSYRGDGALTIKYKINNGDWLTVQQDARVLQFTALSPGQYNIQIQAYNEDGVGEDSSLQINFTIGTPWYKTWYFIAALLLLAIFLLYGYFKRRIYLINKNNTLAAEKLLLEKEVQKSKLASIKSQMNPHFLFNALNTIQSYIYTNDKENASIYLGKFSDLTRSILEMSNNETISLSEEIRTLNLYLELEQLRFEDTLEYKIVYDEKLNVEFIHIPSMLIQPYVENALKHGLLHKRNNRILHITFTKKEKILKVCIDDNGVGRKRSAELNELKTKQHKSFAITANQKRLEILNANTENNIVMTVTDKYDEAGESTGTMVEMLIPIKS